MKRFGIYLFVVLALGGCLLFFSRTTPPSAHAACSGVQITYSDAQPTVCLKTLQTGIHLHNVRRIENFSTQLLVEWTMNSSVDTENIRPGGSATLSSGQAGTLDIFLNPGTTTT